MAVVHLCDCTSVCHLHYCLSLVFNGAPILPPTTTSSHIIECFHPVGIALMSSWDNCQHRCHLCPCDRHIWRGIPCMDSALSVNTTYLACIVVVLLFVILKFSANPNTWLLFPHPFVGFQPHCGHWCWFPPRSHSVLSPTCPLVVGRYSRDTRYTCDACFQFGFGVTDPVRQTEQAK